MKTENALIIDADLKFDDTDEYGRNFKLELHLKVIGGGVYVNFNPQRLPQLLEQLGLEKFSELEGTYIQIPETKIGDGVCNLLNELNDENGQLKNAWIAVAN